MAKLEDLLEDLLNAFEDLTEVVRDKDGGKVAIPAPQVRVSTPPQPAPQVKVDAPVVNVQNDRRPFIARVVERDGSGRITQVEFRPAD